MRNNQFVTLSWFRCIALVFLYFIFYAFLLEPIVVFLTLKLHPEAIFVSIPISFSIDLLLLILIAWIAKPVWKDGFYKIKQQFSRNLKLAFKCVGFILVVNMALSILVSLFTNTQTSANQEIIMQNIEVAPLYMAFSALLFAPVVEETIFRGMIFTKARSYFNPKVAMFISACTFGFMHVFASFLAGNYLDLSYFVIYFAIGFVIAWAYEKSESIVVSTLVHFGNNFVAMLPLLLLL